jgi:hypothetical protein
VCSPTCCDGATARRVGWERVGVRVLRRHSRIEPLNRGAAFTPLHGSTLLPHRLLKRRKRRSPMIRLMGGMILGSSRSRRAVVGIALTLALSRRTGEGNGATRPILADPHFKSPPPGPRCPGSPIAPSGRIRTAARTAVEAAEASARSESEDGASTGQGVRVPLLNPWLVGRASARAANP